MKCKGLLTLIALVVTLALLLSSCSTGAPADFTGRLISDDLELDNDFLLWTPDDTTIVYGGSVWHYPGSHAEIYAINVQTLSRKLVENIEGTLSDVKMSADGKTLFYTIESWDTAENWLYQRSLETGERELLAEGFGLAVSADGGHLAYAKLTPEQLVSTYVYNLQTKEEHFLAEGAPATFSPDGNQLLLVDFSEASKTWVFSVMPVGGGEAQPLPVDLGADEFPMLMRWDAEGIRLVVVRVEEYQEWYIHNVTTGDSQAVETSLPAPLAWSPDGKKIAAWFLECLKRQVFSTGCEVLQSTLHVIDTTTGARGVVARLTDHHSIEAIAFSHDGTRVAYSSEGWIERRIRRIYVSELP
jgi:Tol biopolymer transport system component